MATERASGLRFIPKDEDEEEEVFKVEKAKLAHNRLLKQLAHMVLAASWVRRKWRASIPRRSLLPCLLLATSGPRLPSALHASQTH